MKLHEIDAAILELIDVETGEILDCEKLDELEAARDVKIENIALYIKNLNAEAAALKAEKEAFAKRQKTAENRAESLKKYLSDCLAGEKFKTTKVNISFRSSESLAIEEGAEIPEEFLRFKEPEVNKTDLKKAIAEGLVINGVSIVKNQNIQIK